MCFFRAVRLFCPACFCQSAHYIFPQFRRNQPPACSFYILHRFSIIKRWARDRIRTCNFRIMSPTSEPITPPLQKHFTPKHQSVQFITSFSITELQNHLNFSIATFVPRTLARSRSQANREQSIYRLTFSSG